MHAFILLAAGSGSRMRGALEDKVLTPLLGRCALLRCLDAVHDSGLQGRVFVVVRDEAQRLRIAPLTEKHPLQPRIDWVQGGAERQDSVRHALARVAEDAELVFVQDCARPLLSPALLTALEQHARAAGSAVAAARCADTLKQVPADGLAKAGVLSTPLTTPDRRALWAVQTPQVFPRALLVRAYASVFEHNLRITDDASAVEALGENVALLENPEPNPKLTTPADVPLIEFLLARRDAIPGSPPMRIGHGYDIHRLIEGRRLVLGGVEIPHTRGLDGHSDADALTHALCDALLGALAQPDIGNLFPNTDNRWKGVDSQVLLREVVRRVHELGYRVVNVDASIVAEEPKLMRHIPAMRTALAASLQVAPDAVGLKATTNEKTGSLGRAEAIAAHAVCLLARTQT